MLMSKLFGKTLKDRPSDAIFNSHILLQRGGYIRQISNGVFCLLTPALKVKEKIQTIIKEEMDKINGNNIVSPAYEEDAIFKLVKSETKSYNDYPFLTYEFKNKLNIDKETFGGLIKSKDFSVMKGYLFNSFEEDVESFYADIENTFKNIFKRLGLLNVQLVDGEDGKEFIVEFDQGDENIVSCSNYDYKSNINAATSKIIINEREDFPVEEVYTPEIKTIKELSEFLQLPENKLLKATVFKQENSDNLLVVFIRGDYEVDEDKLRRAIGGNFYTYISDGTYDLAWGAIGPYKQNETRIDMYFDITLKDQNNLVCGANKPDYHFKGIDMQRDIHPDKYIDIYKVREGDICKHCGSPLKLHKAIKLGSYKNLHQNLSKDFSLTYLDKNNELINPVICEFTLGIDRLLGYAVEEYNDEAGIIWPKSIAPWQIHISVLSNKKENNMPYGLELYNKLSKNYDVLIDDRNLGAGATFCDADLIGVPVRIVVSSRNIKNEEVEISKRDGSFKKLVKFEEIENEIHDLID